MRRLASYSRKLLSKHGSFVGSAVILSSFALNPGYSYAEASLHVPAPVSIPSVEVRTTSDHETFITLFRQHIQEIARDIARKLQYLRRILIYVLYGIPVAILAPTATTLDKIIPGYEDMIWNYCFWTILQLGPTFIKMAQWASTRPDIFPPKLVEKLVELQDNVQVNYTTETVQKTLQDAFGSDWKDRLDLDLQNPIGAGCVAQVFKGVLRDKNNKSFTENIAVKMIHPHVESLVHIDMELLSIFAKFLDKFQSLEMLNLGETFSEFGEMMKRQLDLRNEAFNLKVFSKKFKNENWAVFPSPVEGFIKKNVLVETLMEGSSILNYMKLKDDMSEEAVKLKLKISDLGCRLILKMVFFDNFIHGDLHPGNILVNFDSRGEPRLVILDCGIVYQSPSEEAYKKLVDISFAFMNHDGRKAGALMLDRSQHGTQNVEMFCDAVQKLIDDSEAHRYFEHLGEYIGRLCDLARVYQVKLDPGYFAIAMALKVVEGVSLALDADLDMVSKCVPIIVKTRTMRALGLEKFPPPEDDDELKKDLVSSNSRPTKKPAK